MPQSKTHRQCPLCASGSNTDYYRDSRRLYLQCGQCQLVWVPSEYHLSPEEEKAEYDKHENSLEDTGYLNFLSRVTTPLLKRLAAESRGLDFGCGPAPALATQIRRQGHSVNLYDLYYFPDESVLKLQYDFISCTEVIEHIANPAELLFNWLRMLKPGGLLAIMTKRVIDKQAFSRWHYKNDPTHICFYSDATFRWIASQWHFKLEIIDRDVVFLTRS
jgi:SAM-dependent methyltransferase